MASIIAHIPRNIPEDQRVAFPQACKRLGKDLVDISTSFRVCISTMIEQYGVYGALAQNETFALQQLLTLEEIDRRSDLDTLLTFPLREYYPIAMAEMVAEATEKSFTQAEIEIIPIANHLADAEACLVAKKEKLLSGFAVDEEQGEMFRRLITVFRRNRALCHLTLDDVFYNVSSEKLREFNFRQLVANSLEEAGIQPSRLCREQGDTDSQQNPEIAADEICPICHELLNANPDSMEHHSEEHNLEDFDSEGSTAELSEAGEPDPYATCKIRTSSCCNRPYHLSCLTNWLEESLNLTDLMTCPTCGAEMPMHFFIEALELVTEDLKGP